MRVQILSDTAVSPNLAAGDAGTTCAFPLTAPLNDGSICCLYRQGSGKHSADSQLAIQVSRDQGRSWADPLLVFDGRDRDPETTVISGAVCQAADDSLLVVFGATEGLAADVYMFSDEGRRLPRPVLATRSADGGHSWSKPWPITPSTLLNPGVTSPPFILPDGELGVPLEYRISPTGPNGSALMLSRDHGNTFDEPLIVAADRSEQRFLCDARYGLLPDGRLISLLWTIRHEDEVTVEVNRTLSSDRGRTWTAPEEIGFVGQITVPLELSGGRLICASNYRLPPEGIRLRGSLDDGATWPLGPVQLWDPAASRIVAQPAFEREDGVDAGEIWEALDDFTFGTPDLVALPDDEVLMTYYATVDRATHVRACRFRVDFC